jgi:hypothetical protein
VPCHMQAVARARRHSSGGHSADPDFLSETWQSALDALDLSRFDGRKLSRGLVTVVNREAHIRVVSPCSSCYGSNAEDSPLLQHSVRRVLALTGPCVIPRVCMRLL